MGFYDRGLASRAGQHDRSWVRDERRAVGFREEHKLDRGLDDHIGSQRDERPILAESRVQSGEGVVKWRECVRKYRFQALAPLGQHRCEVGHRRPGGQAIDAGKRGRKAAIDEDETSATQTGAETVDRRRCMLVMEPGRRLLEGHGEERLEARIAPVLVLAGREAMRADPVRRRPPRPGKPRGTVMAGGWARPAPAPL